MHCHDRCHGIREGHSREDRREGSGLRAEPQGNQGNLHDDLDLSFKGCLAPGFKDVPYDYRETISDDHGRIETRRYRPRSYIDRLPDKDL